MNLKLLAKRFAFLCVLVLTLDACGSWPQEEITISGEIRMVEFGCVTTHVTYEEGSLCDTTRVVFADRPEIIIAQTWQSLKPYESKKVKLVLGRYKYGRGDYGLTNFYNNLRGFVVEPNQTQKTG